MPRRNHAKHRTIGRNRSSRANLRRLLDDLDDAGGGGTHAAQLSTYKSRRGNSAQSPNAPPKDATRIICPAGKVGFPKHIAEQRLEEYRNQPNRRTSRPVRIYECDKCGFWHLTSREYAPRPPRPKDPT